MNDDDSLRPAGAAHPALAVSGLGWGVGGLVIVDDITLEIPAGQFLSVIGPNGAGKTSLINLISGVHTPSSGRIELLGTDVTPLRPARRTRLGLGRTFQTSSLFPGLTVHENVRLSARAATGGSLNLFTGPGPGDPTLETVEAALSQVGLAARSGERVGNLSHGDKRKLEIAVVLAAAPRVLLLDEPTAGVSAEEARPLVELIRSVHEADTTIVMVEHRMEFVVDVSERIAVLHEGRLLAVGSPSEIMIDPAVRAAYLGGGQ